MLKNRNIYLKTLGIQSWELRHQQANDVTANDVAPIAVTIDSLKKTVAQCTACSLHQSRTQTVFGVGNPQAKLMIIGEAPGFYEDQQGEPFVGRAGQLLTAMLQAIGLARHDVYIANILKCRPSNNRDPISEEVDACTPFLNQQIALIQPRLLLALGRIAAHYLLKTKSSLESLRNKLHHYGINAIPLIVSYHPAYLLRNPIDKKKAFLDLQWVARDLEKLGDKPHGLISGTTEQTLSRTTA